MSKIAFIFPGQGAQTCGMGKAFYDSNPESAAVFELAEQVTGLPIKQLCFEPNEKLNITEFTQVCLLTAELAILKAVEGCGITPHVTAGLSLGEYAALCAAHRLETRDAINIVRWRGKFMQEAVPRGGAMSAVLGLDKETVEDVCRQIDGIVSPANYNCPGQLVISGEEAAVEKAGIMLKNAGAKRVAPLKVSGPFHSQMLKGAGEQLEKILENVCFLSSDIPYVCNTGAVYVEDTESIRDILIRQVSSPVRWEQSVRQMIDRGVDTFIEIGPGKTLCGFLKRIDRTVTGINVETPEDLKKLEVLC